jgi:ketosteroid isomerase-like protein
MPEVLTAEARIRDLFATTDAQDVEANAQHVTDDVVLRFGNDAPVVGKDAYMEMSRNFHASLAGLRHEILSLWTVDENTVITEMTVHYERLNGQKLSLPCANVFRLRDGLVHEYQIFMDISPVFA